MSKKNLALSLTPLAALLLLAACGQQQGGPGHAGGPPPVSVAPATQREIQEFEEFTARLEAPDTVEVRAQVAGTVQAVRFKEGQFVRKGEPLFTIDARAYRAEVARAEAQIAALKTQAELAKTDLARSDKVVCVNAVSQQYIDQLRSALQAMSDAAETGKESTRALQARIGRSARLGARSIGVLDAGATSCCLLLQSMARSLRAQLAAA